MSNVPESMSGNMKLLTVIVPLTRMAGRMANLATWLEKSAYLPMSIVIVHDIQDPQTSPELEGLIKKHDNLEIELIEGVFGSPGLARNAGLKGPLATWTIFWDADDLPHPQEVFAALEEVDANSEVVIGNYTISSLEGITPTKHRERIEKVALNPGLWRMAIRSSVISGISFSSTRMGEDQLFLIDLNLGSRKIRYSDKNFYRYFQGNPMQLTSSEESINDVEKTLKLTHQRLLEDITLQNKFSEIILLKLFATTIFRTRGKSRLHLVFQNAPIILQIRPQTLVSFIFNVSKSRKKL
jgi:glycosyltransferase involved in cell wall biosynthesis